MESGEKVRASTRERRALRRGLAEAEGTGLSVPGEECRFAHVEVPGVSVANVYLLPRLRQAIPPSASQKMPHLRESKCGRLFCVYSSST